MLSLAGIVSVDDLRNYLSEHLYIRNVLQQGENEWLLSHIEVDLISILHSQFAIHIYIGSPETNNHKTLWLST